MPFDANVQKKLLGHKVKEPTVTDDLTNRELREKTLLSLARKVKPHMAKALKTMIMLLEDNATPANVRFQASKWIMEFNRSLSVELYQEKYDDEKGEEIQKDSTPSFSLHVIDGSKKEE
jgi:hypothetical protein